MSPLEYITKNAALGCEYTFDKVFQTQNDNMILTFAIAC